MTTRRSGLRPAAILICALACAALGAADAATAKPRPDPRAYPLRGKILGKTAKDWTIEWWQWAYSIPWDQNPLADETGAHVAIGQRGNVWFLGGVFNESGVAVRTATIPTGRALFFPVLNTMWFNDPLFPPSNTVEELRGNAGASVAEYDIQSMIVTLDGTDIRDVGAMRVAAGPFEFTEPVAGVVNHFAGAEFQPGVRWPCVSDGYWCFLKPLPAGQHTIRMRGRSSSFSTDVTYHLTVVDHDQP